jgi:eukaryotic-like serine/threonine-protein kinase
MTPERWRQVTALFHASRDRSALEREALLTEKCRDDFPLRHEVEMLLAGHDGAGAFGDAEGLAASSLLEPGASFGLYRVEELIGRGGMGEVYRAHDTVLGRDVAIKVVPSAFMADPAWLDRLEREARAFGSLNHPNIATIYGIEHAGTLRGLVLEFVDGSTLADRIAHRRLPLDEIMDVASQIAAALEAAHERGIIHRDIKPANIKITPNGTVKILDFGVAKRAANCTPDDAAPYPAFTITAQGAIVGTVAYMSPEQARGQAIDRRTDIWSFGCVLFEMLAGRQAFAGDTSSDTIAAILERVPQWDQLQTSTPERIRQLLRRCLEKDRSRRLRDIGDARIEIDDARTETVNGEPRRRSTWWIPVGAFLGAVLATASIAAQWYRGSVGPPIERPTIRFTITPEGSLNAGVPALSPDGRYLAFLGQRDGVQMIWRRALDGIDAQLVPGSERAQSILWSPDSRSLLFRTANDGWKFSDQLSGRIRPIHSVAGDYGAMWDPHGRIIAGSLTRGGLFSEAVDDGSASIRVTSFDVVGGEGGQLFPVMLPDGRHFLYLSEPSSSIWIASLDSNARRKLIAVDSQAVYVPPGYLLFVRRQTLFAQRFDPDRLTMLGDPIPIEEGVLTSAAYGASFTASADGVLAYRSGTVHATTQLVWVNRSGKRLGTVGLPGRYANIELSNDGTRIALEALNPATYTKHIWTMDTARGVLTQLTFNSGNDTFPIWSPDDRWIMFGSDRNGGWQLYRHRADGVGSDERVATTVESMVPQNWVPDSRSIVYLQRPANLGVLQLAGPLNQGLIDRARFEGFGRLDGYGQVSPDGHWLLYGSNESGRWEAYVRRFPEHDGSKWKISQNGAISPRWRPDGREIYYYSMPDRQIVAVPIITAGTTPQIGVPTSLFRANLLGGTTPAILWRMQYAVAGDGQRFLLNEPIENADERSPIVVTTNWMTALKK